MSSNGANHGVLFEAISLITLYGNDIPGELRDKTFEYLGHFIASKDSNIRYLSLDAMTRLAKIEGPARAQPYEKLVLESVRDGDISVKRRALDLAFVLVDENNAEAVVGELVTCLVSAPTAIKEDLVVKIAILAERFTANTAWYIDTMVRVVLVAGEYVPEPVWHRVVMIVVNNPDIHEYAAEKMFESLQNKFCAETAVALAGYLLGEIGVNICEKPGMSGYDQFAVMHQHFSRVSQKTRAILLTAYAKLLNLYPDTRDLIVDVFQRYSSSR
jgi:AP-2 complex subunit alpha